MKRSLWAFATIAVLASVASADDLDDQLSSIFDQLDKNTDGIVTSDEVTEEQTRHFDRLLRRGDGDENGELTRDEFIAATAEEEAPIVAPEEGAAAGRGAPDGQRLAITPEMLARLDGDGDRKVTLEEIPEDIRPRFARLFERLDVEEIELARLRELAQRQQQLLAERGDDPPAGERPRGEEGDRPEGDRPREEGDRPEGDRPREGDAPREGDRERGEGDRPEGDRPPEGGRPGFGRDFQGPEFFRRIDENGDRRLSQEEAAKLSEIFGELDRNEDGQLDMGELMGAPPMDGAGGPPRGFGGPEGRPPFESGPRPDGGPRPEGDPRRDGDLPRTEDGAPRPEPPRGIGDIPRTEDLAPRPDAPRIGGDSPRTEDVAPRPEGPRPIGGPPRDFNPRQFFNALDTDGNGFLSEEETPERLRPAFGDADSDDDGQLSPEELLGHMQRQREQTGDRGPAPDFETFWSNLDRNADGFVTTEEMPEGRGEEMLNRADADDDGKISRDELRTAVGRGQGPEGDRGEGDRPDAERGEGDRPDGERPDSE